MCRARDSGAISVRPARVIAVIVDVAPARQGAGSGPYPHLGCGPFADEGEEVTFLARVPRASGAAWRLPAGGKSVGLIGVLRAEG